MAVTSSVFLLTVSVIVKLTVKTGAMKADAMSVCT